MEFLPIDFTVPASAQTALFKLRPLTIHDTVKDYDAVMTSRDYLWQRFGEAWRWPAADLTLEQDLIDLAWHQKEFQNKSSFAYSVLNLEESQVLGCVYVYPPTLRHSTLPHATLQSEDAEIWYWARQSELVNNLEQALHRFLIDWLAKNWPFKVVKLNNNMVDIAK